VYGPTKDTLAREPRKFERRIYKCYLSIKNPLVLPWWEANLLGKRLGADSDSVNDKISKWEAEGYDGIVTVSDSGIMFVGVTVTNWIAFRPEQVKVVDVETIEESIYTKILMIVEEILSEEEKSSQISLSQSFEEIPDEPRKNRSRWYFEYHCKESHDSCDADLWYRSHQQVTILELTSPDSLGMSREERVEEGMVFVYKVKFDDGFIKEAFEDELLSSPKFYYRPDPPKAPKDYQ